jgi:hypothetical protein
MIGRVSMKVSALTVPSGKVRSPAIGDRHHEEVDEQQIERKEPDGAAQMALVAVFHDRDLELARQQHDRQAGQQGDGEPVGEGRDARLEQRLQQRAVLDRRQRRPAQAEEAEGDEESHREKGHELDDGLEGDGRDQPSWRSLASR